MDYSEEVQTINNDEERTEIKSEGSENDDVPVDEKQQVKVEIECFPDVCEYTYKEEIDGVLDVKKPPKEEIGSDQDVSKPSDEEEINGVPDESGPLVVKTEQDPLAGDDIRVF